MRSRKSHRQRLNTSWNRWIAVAAVFLLAGAVSCQKSQPGDVDAPRDAPQPAAPRFVRQIEWADKGQWLKGEASLQRGFPERGREGGRGGK